MPLLGHMTLAKSELSHSSKMMLALVPQVASIGTLRAMQVVLTTMKRTYFTQACETTACIHLWSPKATLLNSTTVMASMEERRLLRAHIRMLVKR